VRARARFLIGHIQESRANLIAMAPYQILEASRIMGRRDEAIAGREHGVRDVATQTGGAARYQPELTVDMKSSVPVLAQGWCHGSHRQPTVLEL
jgi:hypothetical protein